MMAKAEILIRNARVRTGAPGAPMADWVAVAGNRIMALGHGDAAGWIGARTRVVDARGATVIPGLNDAHLHLFHGGLALADLNLAGVRGVPDLRSALDAYRARRPGLTFIAAYGAPYDLVSSDRTPNRADLDALCPDLPFLVTADDFHTAWANSAALRLAGIERGADVGEGSRIILDANGEATGELIEFAAMDLIRARNPATARHSAAARSPLESLNVTADERAADKAVLHAAMSHCASLGLTAVHNMDGSLYQLELLAEMDRDEGLPVRVRMPFHYQPGQGPRDLAHAVRWRERFATDRLTCDFVKIFADGVIDSGTAHLLADYSHMPGQRGAALLTDDVLQSVVIEADRLGFQIAVHCVGDAAVRQVLDAYAAARAANGWRDARHRIEHIELIDPADIPRFAELGVVASMQPTHLPWTPEDFLRLLGPDRSRWAFAQADLRAAGAAIVLSSDWPVAPVEPFITIAAALTREPWAVAGGKDHRIGLALALDEMTRAAAWLSFDEARRGTLVPGALADLALLDRDLAEAAAEDLPAVGSRLTLCDGQVTHDPEGLATPVPAHEEA
mgnify:CR=1 FL=1